MIDHNNAPRGLPCTTQGCWREIRNSLVQRPTRRWRGHFYRARNDIAADIYRSSRLRQSVVALANSIRGYRWLYFATTRVGEILIAIYDDNDLTKVTLSVTFSFGTQMTGGWQIPDSSLQWQIPRSLMSRSKDGRATFISRSDDSEILNRRTMLKIHITPRIRAALFPNNIKRYTSLCWKQSNTNWIADYFRTMTIKLTILDSIMEKYITDFLIVIFIQYINNTYHILEILNA